MAQRWGLGVRDLLAEDQEQHGSPARVAVESGHFVYVILVVAWSMPPYMLGFRVLKEYHVRLFQHREAIGRQLV